MLEPVSWAQHSCSLMNWQALVQNSGTVHPATCCLSQGHYAPAQHGTRKASASPSGRLGCLGLSVGIPVLTVTRNQVFPYIIQNSEAPFRFVDFIMFAMITVVRKNLKTFGVNRENLESQQCVTIRLMSPMAIKAQWAPEPEVPSSVPGDLHDCKEGAPQTHGSNKIAHVHERSLRKDRVGSHSQAMPLI